MVAILIFWSIAILLNSLSGMDAVGFEISFVTLRKEDVVVGAS